MPLLFNIDTMDFANLGLNNIFQFPDDLVIWEINNNLEVAFADLNRDVKTLSMWMARIELFFLRKNICDEDQREGDLRKERLISKTERLL